MRTWSEAWNTTKDTRMTWTARNYLARQMAGRRDYHTYIAGIMAREGLGKVQAIYRKD